MFNKAALLSVVLPLVSALTLQIPTNPVSSNTITINWDFQPSDPVFSLYLINTAFHDSFAIANNVQPTLGTITLELPVVPAVDGYTLEAVNIGNINDVYSQTGSFSIAANPSTTATSSGSSSGTASSSSRAATATTPITTAATTSSAFGVTVAPSSSSRASTTGSGITSGASAAATSNAAGSPVKFTANFGGLAAVVASVAAGVAVFAF